MEYQCFRSGNVRTKDEMSEANSSKLNGEFVAMNARLYTRRLKILRRVSFIYICLSFLCQHRYIFVIYYIMRQSIVRVYK